MTLTTHTRSWLRAATRGSLAAMVLSTTPTAAFLHHHHNHHHHHHHHHPKHPPTHIHTFTSLSASSSSSPTPTTTTTTSTTPPPITWSPPIYISDQQRPYRLTDFPLPRPLLESGELESILLPAGLIHDRIDKMAQDLLEDILLSSSQTDIPPPTHIHMLCVLKGAGRFYQTLLDCMRKRIQATGTPLRLSLEYIKVKSYSGTQSTGQVSISGCDLQTLTHTHCVIVEDIIDTGNTLRKLVPMLWAEAQPASVRVVALFQKRLGGGEAASSTTTTITTSSTGTHTHTQTQKGQGKSEGKGEKEKTQTQTQTQTVEATVAASTPIPNLSVVGFSLPDKFAVGYGMDLEEEYRDLEHLCLLSPKGIEMHLKK